MEAVIGATVLVVSGFFIYLAYETSGEKIKDGYQVTARFEDVSGLTSGADVKVNGIKVGIVKNLSLEADYTAKANLLIQSKYKIPKDSSVSISTDGIMGNKFVAVSVGYSKDYFKQGDEVEDTKSSLNLEKLVDKFITGAGSGSK